MRRLLLVFVIFGVLKSAECVNGVIWNKQSGNFVPIFSIPSFASMRQEILRKSLEKETHNFQGKIVRFSYYEITNIINTEENGTKVGGVIGEVWNILAAYLNFTLKPMLTEYRTLGIPTSNGTYENGLLTTIQLNETDVIGRVEARNSVRLKAVQFSMPLWKTDYRLYIQREVKFLSTWMLKLFSPKVWYSILWMYLLLTVCSYASQKTGMVLTRRDLVVNFDDHLFYNFGTIAGQTHPWECVSKSSRMVNLWLTTFPFLIRTSFSALIINYIWWTTIAHPFQDIHSLIKYTSYNIATLSGSLPDILFKKNLSTHVEAVKKHRLSVVATMEELYVLACSNKKQWAIYIDADIKKANGMFICRLNPAGKSMFHTFIVSGISWNFEYKRTIDRGILRLHEAGIMKLLTDGWLESQNAEEENNIKAEQIDSDDVYLITCIFIAGLPIALAIFVLENLTFYYNKQN